MSELKLYCFPGTCGQVTLAALEHIGVPYEYVLTNILSGEQYQPDYQGKNPRSKVPALEIDGEVLTENAAILIWLDSEFPEAGLFPKTKSNLEKAEILSDLFWISSGWHPSVRANRMPASYTTGDTAPVQAKGRELVTPLFTQLNKRLEDQTFYYGEEWSIIDVYVFWAYNTAASSGFDLSVFGNIEKHKVAVTSHPALSSAMAKEGEILKDNPAVMEKLMALMKK